MPIDFNFRRQVIQNDHCYTPLTQSPERNEKSQKAGSKAQPKSAKREHKPTAKIRQQQVEEESSDSGEAANEDDEEYDEEQSEEDENISFSESDDDNDMDFSVNDRFGKKGKKKRKYRKHKQRKEKDSTFKDFLETGDVLQIEEEPKKKYTKAPKKLPVAGARPSTSGKNVSVNVKNTQQSVAVKKVSTLPVMKRKEAPATPTAQFVPLTASFMKSQLSGQISIQSVKTKQEISKQEFVDSMVKDLEKSFPETGKKVQQTTIPNIMQMMETNTSAEVLDQSLSSLEQLDSGDGAVPNIEEIGDALIAVLGNDAIDELLNQNDLINFDTTHSTPMSMPHSISMEATTSSNSPVSSNLMPKILNKQAPVKESIKVVRNGRIITLPPIEAPTTRGAKRRAQGDSPNTSLTSINVGKVAKVEKTPSTKDPDSRNSSRRSSLNKSETSGKSSRRQSVAPVAVDDELDDLNSDASWASEDDPDRLWCICQQPHNNRFMICCDKCEDWFHGKCVNVTKAMGREFEERRKEWTCPNCKVAGVGNIKKVDPSKKNLNQQKLTKFFAKSQKESTDEETTGMCVVCNGKPARDSSIYCSDECIRNHATKHLDEPAKPSASKPEAKRGNVLKDKNGNVRRSL
jgi:hypothetical protein